jgi:hypothetical protein
MRRLGGWYVPAALRGTRNTWRRHSRVRSIGAGLATLALAASLAACGGGSSSSDEEPSGTYRVKVTRAEFPTKQRLGQTSLMRIGVRNSGEKTIPALAVTITIAGQEGETSSLPFGIHDPQPGIGQPDRPVWVLAAGYPKRDGSSKPGGTQSLSKKTFDFGPLKPGATIEGVWKLSAVKPGGYRVLYGVDAGVGGAAEAETSSGVEPGGSFAVKITRATPETEVTDSGEVVEIGSQRAGATGQKKSSK